MSKTSIFIKNSILLFIILFSNQVFSQASQFKEIDDLLQKADISNKKYQDLKELEYGQKANVLAKKTGNSERIAKSYFFIARSLLNLGLQKESFAYIQKASEQSFTKKDVITQALIAELKGSNYDILNLQSQYAKEEFKAINLVKNKIDYTSLEIKSRAYANLSIYNLYHKKNMYLAFFYLKLQAKQLNKLPEEKYFPALCEHYSFVGNAFLYKKQPDSALYYLQKSCQLKKKYKDPVLYVEDTYLGEYYEQQKQYEKALYFYLKAVKNIQAYSIRKDYLSIYNNISEIYGKLGKTDKQAEYKNLYLKIQKEVLTEQNNNMDYALNVILNDEKNENILSQKKNYYLIFTSVLILLIIFLFIYKFLQNNIKHKENIISEVTNSLQNKEEIISLKNTQTEKLQQKVNYFYPELIELAKNNDPLFYLRFQEIYPEFQKKILDQLPKLRTSELVLCAYIFLGFTIKDIAEYTSKSINTIRNRKHNLRKKFNVPTEEDMGIWLRNLIEQKA